MLIIILCLLLLLFAPKTGGKRNTAVICLFQLFSLACCPHPTTGNFWDNSQDKMV